MQRATNEPEFLTSFGEADPGQGAEAGRTRGHTPVRSEQEYCPSLPNEQRTMICKQSRGLTHGTAFPERGSESQADGHRGRG